MPGVTKATTATAILTDIEVEEVSTVDRAANKRKFLIRKNADGVPVANEVVETVVEVPAETPASEQAVSTETAVTPPAGKTGTVVESAVETPAVEVVAKRGAKMAKNRLKCLLAAVDELSKIAVELNDEVKDDVEASAEPVIEPTVEPTEVTMSEAPHPLESKVVELEKRAATAEETIATMAKEIEAQKLQIAKQAELIAKARGEVRSNSREPEGDIPGADKRFAWGADLNEGRKAKA